MNIQEIRSRYPEYKDLSDEELSEGLRNKYYPDVSETEFGQQTGTAPVATSSPSPNSLLQRAAPYVRELAQLGGMIGGGTLGAGAGPGTALAGAGLGYAAGRQAGNLYEQLVGLRQPPPLNIQNISQQIGQVVKDVGQGATMEATGGLLGKGLQSAAETIAPRLQKAAMDIYGHTLKPSTILKPAVRENLLRAGVEHEIYPTQEGYEKLRSVIDTINKDITRRIGQGEKTINMAEVVRRVEDAKRLYKDLPPAEARPFLKQIDRIKENYLSAGEIVSARQAQKMKQSIYSLLSKHYGELKSAPIEARKQIARGLKEELVTQYPELQALNAEDSALLSLENALGRAIGRLSNRDLVGLTELGGGLAGHAAGAPASAAIVATKVARLPGVQARLAFALNKGGKALARKGSSPLTRAATQLSAYGGIPSLQEEEQRWKTLGNES